jgi:hypothetical protein
MRFAQPIPVFPPQGPAPAPGECPLGRAPAGHPAPESPAPMDNCAKVDLADFLIGPSRSDSADRGVSPDKREAP